MKIKEFSFINKISVIVNIIGLVSIIYGINKNDILWGFVGSILYVIGLITLKVCDE